MPSSPLEQLADKAQQAFSAENYPTLYLGVPSLEALHAAWTKRRGKGIQKFDIALDAGLAKLTHYYDKTGQSDAYLMAMGTL